MDELSRCTGCGYCRMACPRGIPVDEYLRLARCDAGVGALPQPGPSACIRCRSCEAICPAQLPVAALLQTAAVRLAQGTQTPLKNAEIVVK